MMAEAANSPFFDPKLDALIDGDEVLRKPRGMAGRHRVREKTLLDPLPALDFALRLVAAVMRLRGLTTP